MKLCPLPLLLASALLAHAQPSLFTASQTIALDAARSIATADVNRDNFPDLLVASYSAENVFRPPRYRHRHVHSLRRAHRRRSQTSRHRHSRLQQRHSHRLRRPPRIRELSLHRNQRRCVDLLRHAQRFRALSRQSSACRRLSPAPPSSRAISIPMETSTSSPSPADCPQPSSTPAPATSARLSPPHPPEAHCPTCFSRRSATSTATAIPISPTPPIAPPMRQACVWAMARTLHHLLRPTPHQFQSRPLRRYLERHRSFLR